MTSHFVAVQYANDGVEINGVFSELEPALAATTSMVEEWDCKRMRRWWNLSEHSDWEFTDE